MYQSYHLGSKATPLSNHFQPPSSFSSEDHGGTKDWNFNIWMWGDTIQPIIEVSFDRWVIWASERQVTCPRPKWALHSSPSHSTTVLWGLCPLSPHFSPSLRSSAVVPEAHCRCSMNPRWMNNDRLIGMKHELVNKKICPGIGTSKGICLEAERELKGLI